MPQPRRKWELIAAAAFVVVHLTSPLWIGELYPFTISPMFCDSPTQCCRYEVFADQDRPVDARLFDLHLVYDGNPPGLGMGIVAQPTLHEFGHVATEQQVVAHVRQALRRSDVAAAIKSPQVTIVQHHFYPDQNQIKHDVNTWVVDVDFQGPSNESQSDSATQTKHSAHAEEDAQSQTPAGDIQ